MVMRNSYTNITLFGVATHCLAGGRGLIGSCLAHTENFVSAICDVIELCYLLQVYVCVHVYQYWHSVCFNCAGVSRRA